MLTVRASVGLQSWLVAGLLCAAIPAQAQLGMGGAVAEANRVIGAADDFVSQNDCVSASTRARYERVLSDAEDIAQTLHTMWRSLATDNNGRGRYRGGAIVGGSIAVGPGSREFGLQEDLLRVREAIQALRRLGPCRTRPSIEATPSIHHGGGRPYIEGFFAGSDLGPRDLGMGDGHRSRR